LCLQQHVVSLTKHCQSQIHHPPPAPLEGKASVFHLENPRVFSIGSLKMPNRWLANKWKIDDFEYHAFSLPTVIQSTDCLPHSIRLLYWISSVASFLSEPKCAKKFSTPDLQRKPLQLCPPLPSFQESCRLSSYLKYFLITVHPPEST
jgi:hypothetical protein